MKHYFAAVIRDTVSRRVFYVGEETQEVAQKTLLAHFSDLDGQPAEFFIQDGKYAPQISLQLGGVIEWPEGTVVILKSLGPIPHV